MTLTPTGLRFLGRRFPCVIGKGGIKHDKREGDGATPVGRHRIVGMMYRPDRLAAPTGWAEPIGISYLWSDDSADPSYNHLVQRPYQPSHEVMRRADPLYDLVLITDYNWPVATPGAGSAIFLHQWRRPGYPTEGCIAFAREHLHWIAKQLTPGTVLNVPDHLAD
ncbi:MAG: L,D-transpeptidase family protein [Pseudomonadota bacterium]|nr:L,D-transpeptidase family protein [Pseudomonadota bacterium]